VPTHTVMEFPKKDQRDPRVERPPTDKFSTVADAMHRGRMWTAEEIALIFGRLIINDALAGELTPHLAERWGTWAGHYGLLALAEQEARS
jgi:hypothetical protein